MFCKNCGKKLDDNSKFCNGCGFNLENSANSPSMQTENNNKTVVEQSPYKNGVPHNQKKRIAKIAGILVFSLIAIIIIIVAASGGIDPTSEIGSGSKDRLKVLGTPTMTTEYNEYLGWSVRIKGQAINNGSETKYVSITFNVLDASGNIIGSVMDNHNVLGKGSKWSFNATVGYSGNIKPVRFELADIICY